jgi:hypothetical protein
MPKSGAVGQCPTDPAMDARAALAAAAEADVSDEAGLNVPMDAGIGELAAIEPPRCWPGITAAMFVRT